MLYVGSRPQHMLYCHHRFVIRPYCSFVHHHEDEEHGDASGGGSRRRIRLYFGALPRRASSRMSRQAPAETVGEEHDDRDHNKEALNAWMKLTEAASVLLDPKVRVFQFVL